MRRGLVLLGLAALAAAWLGPLPRYHGFAAHMTVHLVVVAVAAPLIAAGLPRLRLTGWAGAAVVASVVEFTVVWAWHAPVLHDAARGSLPAFVVEQASFFGAGLLLWLTALGGDPKDETRTLAGMTALLLTSMHMTLLGALIALASRPLFLHDSAQVGRFGLTVLQDQQLGGTLMIAVGGVVYLIGGLALAGRLLRDDTSLSAGGPQAGERP